MDHLSSLCLANNGEKIPRVREAVTDPCILRLDFSDKKMYFEELLENGNIQSFQI